ncbi:fimbrillin family protein [Bacteroides intestinalis]|uniref:fimbrillin family protein n=2 Tax=Bacteroides intestinalis TaxID=329854 RepID=UPI001D0676FD|nr:fimbrillin family protein [Bacteroides intestinalis]MCB6678440.1 fimbrillin family protein [Bacteroides intestinalis]MCB7015966.1 fimbrillin family protein [Bacteroides intestinalis]
MKQHHSIFPPAASLACALILMLAACTSDALDELPPAGTDPDARPLTITVSDGGMYATGQTRAQERGYSTVFTEGDCIGLYVVKDGTLEVKNLCLTLQGGKWTLPAGASQLFYSPDKSYHAYYPYQNDSDMNGKVLLPGDEDFFKSVVETWLVNPDQSTYAQYTASDLMTARGMYNNHTLSFAMEHRMSLLILQVPATKYTYTEKIDGQEISKSYYRYTAVISENSYWQENPCTARLLLNTTDPTHLNPGPYKYYYNGTKETFNLKYSQLKLQPGKYTVHTLGDSKVTEESRSLKAGDYYMQDGSILPGDEVSNLSRDELRKSCLGVVFWVGEIEGIHWTQTGTLAGDRLLMRDHPECVHGMVVAMDDTSSQKVKWATGKGATEGIYEWAESFKDFTSGEQADWEEILASDIAFGYYSSRLMALYGSRNSDTTFPVYDAIATYATTHPAPTGSSGWFLPGRNELATLCFGVPIRFADDYTQLNMLKKTINPQIDKADGDKLTGEYWSSDETGTVVWRVNLDIPGYGVKPKTDTYKVRAVLAF